MRILGWIIASILATIILPLGGIMLSKSYVLTQQAESLLLETKQLQKQIERSQKDSSENTRK